MKTNLLKTGILILVLIGVAPRSHAFNTFECLRDLMPVTDRATFAGKRNGVEEPFLVNNKYLVFPEVANGKVSGFYFYSAKKAAYYDAVDVKGGAKHLGDLIFRSDEGIYDLVAQPEGLETVTVSLLPGFQYVPKKGGGPVMLGASVLPVVGAFVSRPSLAKSAYHNPNEVNEVDLKNWLVEHSSERRPASVETVKINKTLLRMKTVQKLPQDELMRPIRQELELRRGWVRNSNLDEKAFKQLSLIMETSCKE